jgi:hypothetical protein
MVRARNARRSAGYPVIPVPLRLDRIQRALFENLSDAVAPVRVAWGYNEQTFESVPDEGLVDLRMIGGPSPFIRSGKRGTLLNAADSITITVDAVEVGKRYIVRLNGFDYRTDAVALDTVTTIRDRLRDAINADELETATALDAGADGLTLAADSLGGLRSLQLVGALTSDPPVLNGASVLVVEGTQTMLVNVQAFSKGREPRSGAWAIVQQLLAALQSEDYVEAMRRLGVGVWTKGIATDLSAIAGAHWETRASFDLTVAARAVWVRPISRIETIDLELQTACPSTSNTFTLTP